MRKKLQKTCNISADLDRIVGFNMPEIEIVINEQKTVEIGPRVLARLVAELSEKERKVFNKKLEELKGNEDGK